MLNEEAYLGVSPMRLMMLNAADESSQLLQGMIDGSDTETNSDYDTDYDYDTDIWGMAGASDEEEIVNVTFDEARGVRLADAREAIAAMVSTTTVVSESSAGAAVATVATVGGRLMEVSNEAMVCDQGAGPLGIDGLTGGPALCLPSCIRNCCRLVRYIGGENADTVSFIVLTFLLLCIHFSLNHDDLLI